ncbi:hypothetical protein AAVH_20175 [Aphelenchoides avenae]|nr:hypothetical protein AAVH_20175 [Aphelenchus avenae]
MVILSADASGGLGLFDGCDELCEDSCDSVRISDVAPDGMFVSKAFGEKIIPCLAQQIVIGLAAQVICGSALEDFCTQVLAATAQEAEEIRARQTAARIPDVTQEFLIRQTRLRAEKCAKVKKTLKSTAQLPLLALIGGAQGHAKYSLLELREGCIGIYWEGANLLGRAWEATRAGNDKDLLQDPHIVLCRPRDKPSFAQTFTRVIEIENLLGAVAFARQHNFGGSCISMTVILPPAASDTTTLLQNLGAIMLDYGHVAVGLFPPVPIITPEYDTVAAWLRQHAGPPYEITSNGGSLLQVGRYGTGANKRYVRNGDWAPEGLRLLRAHFMQLLDCLFLKDKPLENEGPSGLPMRQLSGLTLQASAAS